MATLFLMLIYLAFISLGLPDSLLGSAWPVMRLDIGAPLDAAGLVAIVISGGTILSSLMSEKVIAHFGTGKVTAVSVLATAAALLAASFTGSLGWLFAVAVPLGLGAGAVDAALNNYVALHYKPRHMSWLHAFWGVGAFIGPLIMGLFLGGGAQGWRGGYRTIAIIQFAVCALLFLSLPLWKSREASPLAGGAATPPQQSEAGATTAMPLQNKPKETTAPAPLSSKNAIRMPGVLPALLTFLLYCAAEYTIGLWGSSYLVAQRGFAEAAAAGTVATYYMGITAGRFLSGFLTTRFSGRVLIRTGILVLASGAVLLALPLPGAAAPFALMLIGLGCAPIYPSMIHETPRRFGAENSQKIIGWQMAAAYCGSTFVPPLVGALAARTTMAVLPWFMVGYGVLMFVFSERITRAVRKRKAAGPSNH